MTTRPPTALDGGGPDTVVGGAGGRTNVRIGCPAGARTRCAGTLVLRTREAGVSRTGPRASVRPVRIR